MMRTGQATCEEAATAKQMRIQGAGLDGTLRLRIVTDGLAHVLEHADADEPSGTWTGLACPDHGLAIGSDVDTAALVGMCRNGEVADLFWEAPADLTQEHNQAFHRAMQADEAQQTELTERHWSDLAAIWSHVWAANWEVLEFMQEAGFTRFSLAKPQRWVIASFEHHCGPHGVELPHVHNIVVAALTASTNGPGAAATS
jgi:hypothetical protein